MAFPMRTLFNAMGVSATYNPPSGSPVPLKAMRATLPLVFGKVEIPAEGLMLDVLRADVTPVVGGSFTVDGVSHTVDAVLPFPITGPKLADPEALKWRVLTGWGSAVTLRAVDGTGPTQNPPSGSGFTVAANASAGASTINIRSTYVVGQVRAGDRFTVAGDATVYTITNTVSAASNVLTGVSFTPVLNTTVSAGAAVTFTWARDYSVKAAIGSWQANEMLGGVLMGDRRLIIPHASLVAAGWAAPDLLASHKVLIGGRQFNVQSATAAYQSGAPIVWEAQVRGAG